MPIIEGIPEPKFGDREKQEQDNAEYNKPLNKPLDETKNELKSLFGDFNNSTENPDILGMIDTKKGDSKEDDFISSDNIIDPSLNENEGDIQEEYHKEVEDMSDTGTEEEYQDKMNDKLIKESKEYPLVKNYLEERNIQVEGLTLDKDGKIDINSIDGLSVEDKEMLNGLIVNIEGDNRQQNIIDFSNSIKDITEFSDYNLDIDDNGFDNGVLNKIGENYISIPDKDGNIDIRKNISTSIELTKNQICLEAKNFNRDSQTYKTALVNIESGNLKKQLEGINSLYYLAYSTEGKLGAKDSLKAHKNKRKKELIDDANILEQRIQEALKKNNQEEFKKLDLQKDAIIKEVKELVKGDIFESGDLDIMSENEPEKKEQN